jgi:hypothetical protein
MWRRSFQGRPFRAPLPPYSFRAEKSIAQRSFSTPSAPPEIITTSVASPDLRNPREIGSLPDGKMRLTESLAGMSEGI